MCAVVLTALSLQVFAADNLDKEVRVTRAYVPTVEEATKLTLVPDTSDDNYIKPDIDYSITPTSISTSFESDPYAPTKMSFGEYSRPERFYIKAGGGYPFNTVFDLYLSSLKSSKGYIMGYANQSGHFADLVNDYGEELNAAENHIRGGVAGGLYLGNQTLEASLNYDNDRWSRYATNTLYNTNPLYQTLGLDVRYGDNFLDLKRFNFAIDANADYFWGKEGYNSTDIGANGHLGYHMLGGDFRFIIGYNSISGSDEYSDNTFVTGLHYAYSGDKLSLGLGLNYYNDIINYELENPNYDYKNEGSTDQPQPLYGYSTNSNYVIPKINLDYKLSDDKAIVYIAVDGDINHNNFARLSSINPYITPGLSMPESSVEYNADLGLKGRIANNKLGYNFHVGYTNVVNKLYWAYYEIGAVDTNNNQFVNNMFDASVSDQYNINLNLDLEYQPTSNLLFQLDLMHANYTNDEKQVYADGDANTQVRFNGQYRVGKMHFGLNAKVMSSREFSQLNMYKLSTVELPSTIDMGLSVDYKHNDKFVIFADVENLLNDDLYPWLHYRGYGINFAAGVKLQF